MVTIDRNQIFLVIITIILSVSSAYYTSGLLVTQEVVANSGKILTIGIGVYSDSNCTIPMKALTWGSIIAGTSSNQVIYIKNKGDIPVTLSCAFNSWEPTNIINFISTSWDKENFLLNPGESTKATITMSVKSSITGISNYSFTLIINGTSE